MNKPKKVDYKKTLVRNTERPVSKCKLVVADSQTTLKDETIKKVVTQTKIDKSVDKASETTTAKLDSPELYSTLKLSHRIDNIVKPRKTKSCSDVEKKKLAVDEKLSRKVNFPYDQPIYKDLIPLTCNRVQSQPVIASRGPLPQKDKEPVLSDFIEARKIPNYYYLPTVKIENKPITISNDNLRLYKLLQNT
ncbi:hypothetical protein NQ314_009863 [Rhamnusium bicolor]|uniref:Protein phosphatase 1 regulatory subunit 35 C-terminal domain-containing protein n=1 Tax=Rhamnusium bicolor TaxID=1586634 RepID=A0AAV8XXC6_9CUCU|nr:hypothetical protein NQ314_009863 [Rhamnusium bicolor]